MTKIIDRIFIYIYTWHYEMNNNSSKTDPTGIASSFLGLGVAGWLAAINIACSYLIKYDFASSKIVLIIAALSLIAGGLFHNYYISDNRAIKLYTEYKSSPNQKSLASGIVLAVLFMLIPFVLLVLFIFVFNLIKK